MVKNKMRIERCRLERGLAQSENEKRIGDLSAD